MKNKFNYLEMVYTLLLWCGLIIALVMLPFGKNVFAQSYGSKRQDEYFCNTEDDFVLKDILDGQAKYLKVLCEYCQQGKRRV